MPNLIVILVGLILLAVAIYLVSTAIRLLRSDDDALQDRLKEFGSRDMPSSLEEIEMSLPFSERVLRPVVRSIATIMMRFTPQQTLASTQHMLDLAGNPNNWSPAEFWGIRIVVA